MNDVIFNAVTKQYKGNKMITLKNFNLTIQKGEFIVIVGPSGSGKSTLLELICGFEALTSGSIEIAGKKINDVLPKDRNVAMVFQNYALLPHLTVYDNIAFGMKIRKQSKKVIEEKVKWAATVLKLEDCLQAKPKNLSGGQRQRVALARAIVREPELFLMDEPLSNLDAKLRYATCHEIMALHEQLKITTIYVTHDQIEALTMAQRIVVLNEGEIQQIGTPMEVYLEPANLFVATFIGRPQMNLMDIMIEEEFFMLNNTLRFEKKNRFNEVPCGDYILGIRSESIQIVNDCNEGILANLTKLEYVGSEMILYLECQGCHLTLKTYEIKPFKVGDTINIAIDFEMSYLFDKKTTERLRTKK